MNRHVIGILIGMIAAAWLTPVIRSVWERAFPPKEAETLELPYETWQACTHIDFEATVFAVLMPAVFLSMIYGFGAQVDFVKGVMFTTGIFAGYTTWTLVRISLKGRKWFGLYRYYLEAKYKISAKSAIIVVGGISLIFVAVVSASLLTGSSY